MKTDKLKGDGKMKKALLIIGVVIAVIAIAVACFGIYVVRTPEYALAQMIKDVNSSGMDGLRSHLTADAQEKLDTVAALADNKLVGAIVGLFAKDDYVSVLKSEMQQVQWEVEDVMKGSNNAEVILSFNYEERLIGTIALSLVKDDGEWKIDSLELPKFDEINW